MNVTAEAVIRTARKQLFFHSDPEAYVAGKEEISPLVRTRFSSGAGFSTGKSSACVKPLLPIINWPEKTPPFSTEIDFAVTLPSSVAPR